MTEKQPTDSSPEIDFDHLNLYVDGDADLTAELFSLFQNQCETWMKMISMDVDADMFSSAAHTLKGTAQAVGAMRLAHLCQQAEDHHEMKGSKGRKAQLIQDIEFTVSRVVTEIKRWEHRRMIAKLDS